MSAASELKPLQGWMVQLGLGSPAAAAQVCCCSSCQLRIVASFEYLRCLQDATIAARPVEQVWPRWRLLSASCSLRE